MSVVDLDKVDAVGTDKDEDALRLMIADHLDWENEDIHLEILQDKINLYLQYLENQLYADKYGNDFSKVYIDIYFKEKVTENCLRFLNAVSEQLNPQNIYIYIFILIDKIKWRKVDKIHMI